MNEIMRDGMIKRLDHVGIVVDDLTDAKTFLSNVLGLHLVREVEVPALARRVAFFKCGESELEVIEDLNLESKAKALHGGSARIEHIALEVDGVSSVSAALAGLGVKIDDHGILLVGSRLNAWTDPSTTDGIVFQLLSSVPD